MGSVKIVRQRSPNRNGDSHLLEFQLFTLSKIRYLPRMTLDGRPERPGETGSSRRPLKLAEVVMKQILDQSDGEFLNTLHRLGPKTVQEIGEAVGVTATAIRQRLNRLQGAGLV